MSYADRSVRARRRAPEELLRTAERLLATHGMEGVSLRQIAGEAGHRNPGVVQYHFGSKAGLLQAIVEYRLPWINQRRLQLLAQLDEQQRGLDLRGLVEAMVRPLLEMDPQAHYVELLARLSGTPEFDEAYLATGELTRGVELLTERLYRTLSHLPPAVRKNRMTMASDLMLAAIANRRARAVAGLKPDLPDQIFVVDLLDAMVGLLGAEHTLQVGSTAS